MTSLLTVLMPVYNAAPFLERAIKSILSQTHRDFEFLIIDNGSTDASPEIIRSFKDPRIRVVRLDKNVGPPPALNLGLRQIRTKYIARMDADDVALPNRLKAQIAFLEKHPEFVLIGSQYRTVNATGRVSAALPLPTTPNNIRWKLMFSSPFVHSAVVMRTQIIKTLDGYDEHFRYASDFDLWSRLVCNNYKVANLSKTYVLNRKHDAQDGVSAGIQKLLDETAQVCAANINHFTDLKVSKEEVLSLQNFLTRQAECPSEEIPIALRLFEKLGRQFKGRRGIFYYRTLLGLGLFSRELSGPQRALFVFKNLFHL